MNPESFFRLRQGPSVERAWLPPSAGRAGLRRTSARPTLGGWQRGPRARAGKLSSSSSSRLRHLTMERCLACEADLEHKAKATSGKLSLTGACGFTGVMECRSRGVVDCGRDAYR